MAGNPYHDKIGRFTTASGGGSVTHQKTGDHTTDNAMRAHHGRSPFHYNPGKHEMFHRRPGGFKARKTQEYHGQAAPKKKGLISRMLGR